MRTVTTLPSTLLIYLGAVLVGHCRTGFAGVRCVGNGSANPKSRQMGDAILTFSERRRGTSNRISQIVGVYGDITNRQNVTKWGCESCEGRSDVHDEQRSGRPSLISDDLLQEIEGEICANRHGTIRELHHIIPEES